MYYFFMSMEFIKEAYVSIETAKMLEEKGFNDYYPKGNCLQYAATQQIVMRWLREIKNIYIEIRRSSNTYFYGAVIVFRSKDGNNQLYDKIDKRYNSYEEAVEEALKYCLENLI